MHLKPRDIVVLIADVLKHYRDHVRPVPLPRLDVTLFAFQADVVDSKGGFAAICDIIHEKFENREVFFPQLEVLKHMELE